MNPNGDDRPIEDRLRDALAVSYDPPVDPALEQMYAQPAPNFQDAAPPQHRHQGLSLHVPGFGGMHDQNVPRHQLAPMAPRPRQQRTKFLAEAPGHDYILPGGGLINATLTDIIVILPQWFRSREMSARFLNNGINAGLHLTLLEEHRHIDVHTLQDRKRCRDRLADGYRKSMRDVDPEWTQGKHTVPHGWNEQDLDVSGFVPDATREAGYTAPSAIPFKDLAVGLKKLPQGNDAGDLTRALDYAMRNRKFNEQGQVSELLFPDDLQAILNQIGRTQITQNHTDRFVLGRYRNVVREASHVKDRQPTEEQKQQDIVEQTGTVVGGQFDSHRLPTQHSTFTSQAPYQSAHENMLDDLLAPQQMQSAPDFPPIDGHHEMPSMDKNMLIPTPYNQVPKQVPLDDPFTDMGYGGTAPHNFSYTVPPRSPCLERSNSQEAAAAVASQVLAQGAQRPVEFDISKVDFNAAFADVDIPSICHLNGVSDPNPIPDFPKLSPEEAAREMDRLMTSLQTPYDEFGFLDEAEEFDFTSFIIPDEFTGLPTPASTSPPSSQLLSDFPEGLDEADLSELARASWWARENPVMGFTVGDVGVVVEMLDEMEVDSVAPDAEEREGQREGGS